MGGLDPAKILLILVVALVVLGPERLPRAARQLGAAWRELTHLRERIEEEVRAALPDLDLPPIPRRPAQAMTSFVAGLFAEAPNGSGESAPADVAADAAPGGVVGTGARGTGPAPVAPLSAGTVGWSLVGARAGGHAPAVPALPAAPALPSAVPGGDGLELRLGDPGLN